MAGIPKVIAQEVELLPKAAAAMGSERQIGKQGVRPYEMKVSGIAGFRLGGRAGICVASCQELHAISPCTASRDR